MKKGKFIYGWHSAEGNRLFVYQKPNTWGVTNDLEKASAFGSVQDCIDHYLSKHAWPEDYEEYTRNGYLFFINQATNQIKLF